jgi:SAM-dependent methyltransferase
MTADARVGSGQVRRLNWGCGAAGKPGWINSDLKEGPGIDITTDIRDGLPLESDSLDYIVSIHALPMIPYADLVPVLRELRRVLRPDGVLRLALPDLDRGIQAYLRRDQHYFLVPDSEVRSYGGKFIVHLLWYGYTVTLFTADFIEELLRNAGYRHVRHCSFRQTGSLLAPGILELDNREQESLFVEGIK